jgi:hypothetical protein
MTAIKTRLKREKELQTMLGSLAGKAELEALTDASPPPAVGSGRPGRRSSPAFWSASASEK